MVAVAINLHDQPQLRSLSLAGRLLSLKAWASHTQVTLPTVDIAIGELARLRLSACVCKEGTLISILLRGYDPFHEDAAPFKSAKSLKLAP